MTDTTTPVPTFADLVFDPHPYGKGPDEVCASYILPNGYGASVIRTRFSYGGSAGLYELAVTHDGKLVYDTPVTSDVLGWLAEEDVTQHLAEIAALPAREVTDAGIP